VEEKFMQAFASLKGKIIITVILALSLVLSGAALAAPADAPAKTSQALSVVGGDKKEAAAKAQTIDEINRYLSQMSPAELAATVKLLQVNRFVKNRYVSDVAGEDLLAGAVKGAVAALGDPYSEYMDAKVYKEFVIGTKGTFGGVGIVLGMRDKQLTIIAPIEGTPADVAGLASGDRILKINGQETKEMALDEAVGMIRGREGTDVTLTVGRGADVTDYTITRAIIQIKSVSGKMLEGGIGYIRLSIFNETTSSDLAAKLQELEAQGLSAVILDLRNNPGGLLDEGIKVASTFVPQGPVVSVVVKDGTRDTAYSHLAVPRWPLVVLVNGGSASASEIVAGAIQDTGAGTLVGVKTFGKGSVQTVIKMNDGSAVKLTIAKYLTPKDRAINGTGLEPDVTVEAPAPKETDSKDTGRDPQLEKALEIIKQKLQQ
jgi:carboxyl-terminal processing protease